MSNSTCALKKAVSAIQKLYPISLAETSWDNVGLLVNSGISSEEKEQAKAAQKEPFKILLAVDLTRSVCKEAISLKVNLILAYHPFIFRGLKQIGTTSDPQQNSLVQLIKHDISVYCPHTSIDSVSGGVNDWLVESVIDKNANLISKNTPIDPAKDSSVSPEENGMGRYLILKQTLTLPEIISNIKKHLNIPYVQVAYGKPFGKRKENLQEVRSVAICAGSGASLFNRYLNDLDSLPDLIYTGELSHHEILAYRERGANVIVCNHSNTERGYLQQIKQNLYKELGNTDYVIQISEEDADPLVVV